MGKLFVVGTGNGEYEDLTIKAERVLRLSDLIYCDEKLYEKFRNYYNSSKLIGNLYNETSKRCDNAIKSACSDKIVSILGSGDTGIYGIANIILERTLECTSKIDVEIIPGITFALSGAALLGSPITQDFVVMTLSDQLADINTIQEKLTSIAKTDFGIVFYSICNPTYSNLILARDILLKYRSSKTIIGLTNDLGTNNQSILISTLEDLPFDKVSAYSTLFIGNGKTKVLKNNKMVTPL